MTLGGAVTTQNIFIIGQGGRESAIRHFLQRNPKPLKIDQYRDPKQLRLQDLEPSLFIIGPEAPLVDGISDLLRHHGHTVFGPSKESAQLEGSKVFAKNFMLRAGVPTARHVVVSSVKDVQLALQNHSYFSAPYVLKADGLAGGKGVFICDDEQTLLKQANRIFEENLLGDAGKTALLEERLDGYEMSILVLTNGKEFRTLPVAQDHKRLLDGQRGPNTGGMGTTAPFPVQPKLMERIIQTVIAPSVAQLEKENFLFRGVLFIGLMIVDQKPYILEYNVRFGDPETQSILPLIDMQNPVDLFQKIAMGELPDFHIKENQHTCCVVVAAENYPDQPVMGTLIQTKDLVELNAGQDVLVPAELAPSPDRYVLLGGALKKPEQNQWQVSGGRVLNCVGVGNSLQEAQDKAYSLIQNIHFQGKQFRTDIGSSQDHINPV